jgi:hypothetical protein
MFVPWSRLQFKCMLAAAVEMPGCASSSGRSVTHGACKQVGCTLHLVLPSPGSTPTCTRFSNLPTRPMPGKHLQLGHVALCSAEGDMITYAALAYPCKLPLMARYQW